MQSRRRFFCARVELVQLARAFLCPAPPQPTAASPGRSPQGTPPGYSIPAAPGQSHAGTLDRVQLRDSRPQYHRHSRTAPPGCNPSTAATEGAQSHATGQGYMNTGKPRHRPQSRPQAEKRETPGKAPDSPTEPRNAAGGIPILPQPEKPHRAAHSGAQGQAIHSPDTASPEKPYKCPTEPPGAGVLFLYYPPPKRRTGAHRAAHRGQAAGGARTPGTPPPLPRLALPR